MDLKKIRNLLFYGVQGQNISEEDVSVLDAYKDVTKIAFLQQDIN